MQVQSPMTQRWSWHRFFLSVSPQPRGGLECRYSNKANLRRGGGELLAEKTPKHSNQNLKSQALLIMKPVHIPVHTYIA